MGRHTITGLLTAGGRQFHDWSADYRLFSKARFEPQRLFDVVRRGVLQHLPGEAPLVVAMDDSVLRKTGTKTHGVAYRRDPLGPPFHTNFIRGQRVLQLSAALPTGPIPNAARMIPIDFIHAPTSKKPRRNASEEDWRRYRRAARETTISRRGAARLQALREALDADPGGRQRPLWVAVDGRFTNRTVLKNLPERTILIGRVRKDAKLCYPPPPETQTKRGRKRLYGEAAPTPEQLRQDPRAPWRTVPVFAAGKLHQFKVKTLAHLRWRTAGAHHDLRLIVIAPLAYRPRKGSRLLYRQPAHLICTDPLKPLAEVIQAYLWRWDIEVNFRDEKQLLGVGQAQVRKETSVEKVPALMVAAYAMLLLAAAGAFGRDGVPQTLPPPKWRLKTRGRRASTQQLINHLRAELWGKSMGGMNYSHFSNTDTLDRKPRKWRPSLASAVLYAAA